MNKKLIKTLRLSKDEYLILKDEASRAGLNFSNYVRYRLFDDSTELESENDISELGFDHKRESMRFTVRIYQLIEALAKESLSSELLSEQEKRSHKLLQKWGYE